MPSISIVGLQWGDEGKARIVDILSENADVIVRSQGGANAGHTVVVGDEVFKFHLVPSGIVRRGKACVIANGVVIDPVSLFEEIEHLKGRGVKVEGHLFVSDRAHVVMPYHKILDGLSDRDTARGTKLGTTGRGIGPCYVDKMSRDHGIRVADFVNPEIFRSRLAKILKAKNFLITEYYGGEPLDFESIHAEYSQYAERLAPFVTDTGVLLAREIAAGKSIVFEGAQGTLLDIDHGTYPFVTSSNASVLGVCAGAGVSPRAIDEIIGVLKAYTTRVGEGPIPTELDDEIGETIRQAGHEFGTTTGRPRRTGWLDLVAARYSVRLNGIDSIALTRLDILGCVDELKIAVAYRFGGRTIHDFPADTSQLDAVEPVYETLAGWKTDISKARTLDDLPEAARRYVRFIEENLGKTCRIIGVGPERREAIVRE